MSDATIEDALAHIASELRKRGQPFALVGGLGVSIRGEVRFTRDVDVAIRVAREIGRAALDRHVGRQLQLACPTRRGRARPQAGREGRHARAHAQRKRYSQGPDARRAEQRAAGETAVS